MSRRVDESPPEGQNPTASANDSEFEAMLRAALGVSQQTEDSPIEMGLEILEQTDLPPGHKSGYVAVVGRPNVGKSTLINAILGEKIAIVSPKPQTTRLQQLGIYTRDDVQIIFVDTPGIHQPKNNLGQFMVDVALNALRDADIILFLTDISHLPHPEDHNVAEMIRAAGDDLTVIRVLNKVDQHTHPEHFQTDIKNHLELIPATAWTTTVALTGAGVPELLKTIVAYLPQGPRFYPPEQVSDMRVRDMVAEIIREAVLFATQDEVPHSVATLVEEFKERENGVVYISAQLYVERDSQKKILIGKQGQMIKNISTRARQAVEKMLEKKVYLELRVKVMKNWRRDEQMLTRLGYRLGQR